MAAYVLVAHQTALSDELLSAIRELMSEDPAAEFVVLVPASSASHAMVEDERETYRRARQRAQEAQSWLQAHDVRVTETHVGDPDPVQALDDLLRDGRLACEGIVLSTLPPGISRWLKLDVVSRTRRHFPEMRVVHVIAAPAVSAAAA